MPGPEILLSLVTEIKQEIHDQNYQQYRIWCHRFRPPSCIEKPY